MKDYPEFPDLYAVTEDGRIYSKPRVDSLGRPQGDRFLQPRLRKNADGYRGNGNQYGRVALSVSGKYYDRYIHQMVAETYLGPRPDGMVIDHIDGDINNNSASNLEYVTREENINRTGPYFHTLRRMYETRGYQEN